MVQLHSLAPSTCLSWTCGWLRLPMPKRTALLLANGAYTLLGESLWQVNESLNINMVSQSHFSGTHFHYLPCRNNVLSFEDGIWAFVCAVCDLCIVKASQASLETEDPGASITTCRRVGRLGREAEGHKYFHVSIIARLTLQICMRNTIWKQFEKVKWFANDFSCIFSSFFTKMSVTQYPSRDDNG